MLTHRSKSERHAMPDRGQGFRQIGSLTSTMSLSPMPEGSTEDGSSPNTSDSASGTSLPVRLAPTGTRAGTPGFSTRSNSPPTVREAVAAKDSEDVYLAAMALLRRLPTSLLDLRLSEDWEVVDMSLKGPLEHEEMSRLRILAVVVNRPCDKATAARYIHRCFALTKSREQGQKDVELMIGAMAEDLAEFPEDVIATAFRKHARTSTFWPALAEIRDRCLKEMRWRRALWRMVRT